MCLCSACVEVSPGSAGAGVKGSSEPPDVGAENQAPVFCKRASTETGEPSAGPQARVPPAGTTALLQAVWAYLPAQLSISCHLYKVVLYRFSFFRLYKC